MTKVKENTRVSELRRAFITVGLQNEGRIRVLSHKREVLFYGKLADLPNELLSRTIKTGFTTPCSIYCEIELEPKEGE